MNVTVNGKNVGMAMALPTIGIPGLVKSTFVKSIRNTHLEWGLEGSLEFFEMADEKKNSFFSLTKARWKGVIS